METPLPWKVKKKIFLKIWLVGHTNSLLQTSATTAWSREYWIRLYLLTECLKKANSERNLGSALIQGHNRHGVTSECRHVHSQYQHTGCKNYCSSISENSEPEGMSLSIWRQILLFSGAYFPGLPILKLIILFFSSADLMQHQSEHLIFLSFLNP